MSESTRTVETRPATWALRTRWLLTGEGPPIPDAIVTIADDRIVAIGENQSGRPAFDWGPVTLAPGFVNSHTHLEFGNLDAPLGQPLQTFSEWLREIIGQRRAAFAQKTVEQLEEERSTGIQRSLAELSQSGVSLLAEIARPGWSTAAFHSAPSTLVFLELLGLDPARTEPLLELARVHIELAARPAGDEPGRSLTDPWSVPWRAGLSPHAPYTVNLDLLAGVCRLSREREVPVAMHLAESWDELELLASHSGPLVEVLDEFNAWNPSFLPRGLRPRDYLERLAVASRALVIHGNFLGPAEWAFLAERRELMALVYCPRTHDRFLSTRYPLAEVLAAGVRTVIGTDSRATNPDLDFVAELRWAARRHPEVAPLDILAMGTSEAANALGDQERGRIACGAPANFVALQDTGGADSPWGWLLDDVPPQIVGIVRAGCRWNSH